MTASIASPQADTAQHAEGTLARLTQVTQLLTDHPVHGDWDVRDYAIMSLMITELRDLLEYYRVLVADAERRINASARGLGKLQATASSSQEPV
jgi:hypothetical protein